jgi:hypothetical protein
MKSVKHEVIGKIPEISQTYRLKTFTILRDILRDSLITSMQPARQVLRNEGRS